MTTEHPTDTRATDRVPRVFWVGLVAIVVYVLVAAGLGNLMDLIVPTDSVELEFALSHLVPLPIAIAAGLWFARWSGWSHDIWVQEPTLARPPRRWWMLAIPALLLVSPVVGLVQTPWADRSASLVLVVAVGCLLVGLGEEFFYRGILRVSLRARHGELVTLLATSLLFGLSHSLGSLLNGAPVGMILFQVAVTSMDGALYYAVFRVTGRLWVPIVLHALTDFSLYVQSGGGAAAGGHADIDVDPSVVPVQVVLVALSIAVVVSAALEDRRRRRASPAR
ncbi:CPBP family intramembrane glutamic endopeptidase [Agromyces sp. LHK192]|uniref:CPBP family intramembrane glutamic endopeptidase n=1 Tax=Agromyces sp. LHK192 TaxID=2498704 RepID=UPI000FD8A4D4|nr:CPBP family intramembrane glutamic endopeptidase [Agromyces sp. LHK192]